jgi:DNA polymerase III epsilon subunit-like protein
VNSIHALLDEADIVVAHNGNKFDIPKINTRFLQHGLSPPAPYKQIDTLLTAKRMFRITSNRLDYIAQFLGLEGKAQHDGWELWEGCLRGDEESFEKMVDYNIQDVHVLQEVYLKLRPYMPTHPNLGNYSDAAEHECPKCGSENVQRRGYAKTQVGKYQRFQCNDCGGWSRSRYTVQDPDKRKALLTNA